MLALASGALFGIFFALLAQTLRRLGHVAAASPAGSCSITAGPGCWSSAAASRLRTPWRTLPWVALAGVGRRRGERAVPARRPEGLLSVVAPIAALYPVSTVLLALGLDKERVRPVQVAGLGLAATALVLTTI